jgi:inosine-uridine nucleoside N-ribohydrolase
MTARYCRFLLIALHMTVWDAAAQSRKIVIDCDPGIDDAMAIVLALQHPGFEILGITTTFGNAHVDQATRNALTVVELSGRSIPVYKGADRPLQIELAPPPDFVHGKDGLGNTGLPAPRTSHVPKSAAQFLADVASAHPGQVTIIAVARLTNLAQAMKLDPAFTRNVKEVVLMGGAVNVPGNVSPVAEANIGGDPHAADIVLTAPWTVTMIPLNTTTKVKLNDEILQRIRDKNARYGPFVWSISRFYMDFHRNVNRIEGGSYVHDPSAVMYLVDPGLFTVRRGPIRVATEGIAIGETIMPAYDYQLELPPWRGKPAVTAAIDVDVKRFLEIYESEMTRPAVTGRAGGRP